jgi:hypothetical protein
VSKKILVSICVIAAVQIAAGYFWLYHTTSRDFNFGPPLIIMLGVLEGVTALVCLALVVHKSKNE